MMTRIILFILLNMTISCTKKPIVFENQDPVYIDMQNELKILREELKQIEDDNAKVLRGFANTKVIQILGPGLKREYFKNQEHIKNVQQEINILEIRAIKRLSLLKLRLSSAGNIPDLEKIILKPEVDLYLQDKKINPIKKTWKKRFKAAAGMKE
jgi:hypothetical protein